jgi:hypothetical protein
LRYKNQRNIFAGSCIGVFAQRYYGMEYTKEICKLMARLLLDWQSAAKVMIGETPDSSEDLDFDFYGWVIYHDPHAGLAQNVFLGRWLGVAHSVGQAMTYWVLKSNGYVIARSNP